jgi:hypothetical protein
VEVSVHDRAVAAAVEEEAGVEVAVEGLGVERRRRPT